MCSCKGVFSQKALISHWVFRSQFYFETQAPFSSSASCFGTRWLSYPTVLIRSGYQRFRDQGAWAAVSLEQFASLPRDLRNSACTGHYFRHGKAIGSANRQLHQTPPSLKTSPLSDLGSCCWGFNGSRRYLSISDSVLDACILSQEQSSRFISGKCSLYLTNPNPNFCYKIGIFAIK